LESQPVGRPWLQWRVVDAADGLPADGRIEVADHLDHQPWPEASTIELHAEEPA
ncbi:MAG: DUF3556 domain-containing protein, partial [Acidimicrobiales bacterium]